MRKTSVLNLGLLLIAITLVCGAASCKKSTPRFSDEPTSADSGDAKPVLQERLPAPESDIEMAPLPIELPRPMFVGTPQNIGVPNLQKPLGKPRPPFYAPKDVTNVAAGKPVTSSVEEPIIGDLGLITDGVKEAADGSYVELDPFEQYITVDLGAPHEIYAILFWHFHQQARVYLDVVVQLSDDADFSTSPRAVFNNDADNSLGFGAGSQMHYVETSEGKLVDARGQVARYVRLHSNGNTANDLNHYIELEVFGRPVE
jgi:hypothetical protein